MGNRKTGLIATTVAWTFRLLWALLLVGWAWALASRTNLAAPLGMAGLALGLAPWARAWVSARETSLRPALIWALAALVLALAAEWITWGELGTEGRPLAGQWLYLSLLAALAALLSVLNARSPGSGAWAILMMLLVVVFLLPWLEGAWMVRQRDGWDRLRLAVPWNYFLALLIFTGVSNYLGTRYGLAALVGLVGFVLGWLGLTQTEWSREVRGQLFAWVPWCWSLALLVLDAIRAWPQGRDRNASDLDRLWRWFRDHWGSVWALRTRDRFNATADAAGWDFRLDWNGVKARPGAGPVIHVPDDAAETFVGLLRRFATREKLAEAMRWATRVDLANPSGRDDH